jgi:thiamine biosynthesis protein ThiS
MEGLGSSDSHVVKRILVNGNAHETGAGNVAELVAELGLGKGTTLVELNGVALRPEEWGSVLQTNDRVEILRIAAGG